MMLFGCKIKQYKIVSNSRQLIRKFTRPKGPTKIGLTLGTEYKILSNSNYVQEKAKFYTKNCG